MPRGDDDGYASALVPGLHASEDARRLAQELAFSQARLELLGTKPPGAYGRAVELALEGELGRATTLCFVAAYLSPAESEAPFASIEAAFAALELGAAEALDFDSFDLGPRTSHASGQGARAFRAYEAWWERAGSQEAAFAGDPDWSAERRFARVFERLSIHGVSRAARFELLVSLGALGVYELSADSLHLSTATGAAALPSERHGEQVLAAAKRVFGIGDPITLERRATMLAEACETPLAALDLALFNWGSSERATLGAGAILPEAERESAISAALGV
jgi:hypothetical protein